MTSPDMAPPPPLPTLRRSLLVRALSVAALLAGLVALTRPASASASASGAIFDDAGCQANSLGPNDDTSLGPVALGFEADLFGATYDAVFVNNNGNVTFGTPYTGYAGLDLGAVATPIIAAAFYDVDTRGTGSSPVRYGTATYQGRPAFCVNWVDVGYFNRGVDELNSFQLVLVSRPDAGSGAFDIVLGYERMVHEPLGGLTVGYSNGDGEVYVHPGSGVPGALVDGGSKALTSGAGGSGQPGRYVHEVRGGSPAAPAVGQPQSIDFAAPAATAYGAPPFVVAASATSGLPVELEAEGACLVGAGFAVTATGAGACTLTARQGGDATFAAAEPVSHTVVVARGEQRIELDVQPNAVLGDERVSWRATASSELPVTVTAAGACRTVGAALELTSAGSCLVTAEQAGSADYLPAPTVTMTVLVSAPPAPAPAPPAAAPLPARPAGPARPAPVPTPAGHLPALAPGEQLLLDGGVPAPVVRTADADGRLRFAGGGFTAAFSARSRPADGTAAADATVAPLDASGNLRLVRGATVVVEGTGFQAASSVAVWLFSTPRLLGSIEVTPDGIVTGELPVPEDLPVGRHTLQLNGVSASGAERSLSVGVQLDEPPIPAATSPAEAPAAVPVPTTATTGAPPEVHPAPSPATEPAVQARHDVAAEPARTAAASGTGTAAHPRYDPAEHADEVVAAQVAAFALLSLAGGGLATTAAARAGSSGRRKGGKHTSAKVKNYKFGWEGNAPGDASRTWRWPGTALLDRLSLSWPVSVAPRSPLAARVLVDGSYLRAMFGSLWMVVPAAGLVLGALAGRSAEDGVVPVAGLLLAVVLLGVVDASAGVVAAASYGLVVAARGGIDSMASGRTMLGVFALCFAAPLIASAARPLRRPWPASRTEAWQRVGDVVILPLVGAWAAQKMVGALSGLSGYELPIADQADRFALAVLVALAARAGVESAASRWYPSRLAAVAPAKIPFSGPVQRVAATLLRTALFVFVAVAFLGGVWQLYVGAVLFVVPQLLSIIEDQFPNSPALYAALPRKTVKVVVMMFVGSWFARLVAAHVDDPQRLVVDGFVLLALPGLVLSLVSLFGRDGEERVGDAGYHLAGGAVVALGVASVLGIVG